MRSGTLIARWGGEEFVILLPGAEVAVGARLAERVREAVGAIRRDGLDKVTVSIGVAGTEGRELKRPEDLFDEADAALYHAKGSGRDQVVLASSVTGSWTTMPGPNRTH